MIFLSKSVKVALTLIQNLLLTQWVSSYSLTFLNAGILNQPLSKNTLFLLVLWEVILWHVLKQAQAKPQDSCSQ